MNIRLFSKTQFKIAIFISKVVAMLSRRFSIGSGEQIAGRVMLAICPGAIAIASKDKEIIVISATNGKTSITRLIAQAIKEQYGTVISNALGANQKAGVISALIDENDKDSKYCVLEVDERSLPGIFSDINSKILVLGNLSRDQLDRFGEVNSIATSWKKMLRNSEVNIIANASDPNIVFATSEINHKNITYVDIETNWHDDANTCNVCGALLNWSQANYECNNCDFKKPADVKSSKIFDSIIQNNLALPGRWNKNNAKLALFALEKINIDINCIKSAWPKVKDVAGRNATFKLNEKQSLQLFLAKNPAGYNEMLKHISNEVETKKISAVTVFGFNCNIADGKDPSWLYDVRFEDYDIKNCYVFGQRSKDVLLRLEIANKNVAEFKNLDEILKNTEGVEKIFLIASYTQFHKLSKELPKKYQTIDDAEIELAK